MTCPVVIERFWDQVWPKSAETRPVNFRPDCHHASKICQGGPATPTCFPSLETLEFASWTDSSCSPTAPPFRFFPPAAAAAEGFFFVQQQPLLGPEIAPKGCKDRPNGFDPLSHRGPGRPWKLSGKAQTIARRTGPVEGDGKGTSRGPVFFIPVHHYGDLLTLWLRGPWRQITTQWKHMAMYRLTHPLRHPGRISTGVQRPAARPTAGPTLEAFRNDFEVHRPTARPTAGTRETIHHELFLPVFDVESGIRQCQDMATKWPQNWSTRLIAGATGVVRRTPSI